MGEIDVFILSWVQSSIELLAKKSPRNNPKEIFPESDAVKVFDAAIQKGGAIPLWLDMMKPPPLCKELKNAVEFTYSSYPDPVPPEPEAVVNKGGKGKGKSGGCWGGGWDGGG